VKESAVWQNKFGDVKEEQRPRMRDAFNKLFSPQYRQKTVVMSVVFLTSIIGLWAGSIYVPTAVTQIAVRQGYVAGDAARMASYGSMILAVGTIIGCVLAPILAERLGRRKTMASFFVLMACSVIATFGYVFYLEVNALPLMMVCIFLLGLGGANFAMYTLWLPEQYPTDCRASAIAFVSSVGRFVGVAMVFMVGAGVAAYGSLGVPVALTAVAFIIGLAILPLAEETRGKALPA
jgi:MFS family permease